jgi:hypothetical protein
MRNAFSKSRLSGVWTLLQLSPVKHEVAAFMAGIAEGNVLGGLGRPTGNEHGNVVLKPSPNPLHRQLEPLSVRSPALIEPEHLFVQMRPEFERHA